MGKNLRVILLIILIAIPIIFYKSLNKRNERNPTSLFSNKGETRYHKPMIALIFDDLGESLGDLRELYSLGIPITVAVIPNLKFSKNIAHIASRCGFSVFIHLPLEPSEGVTFKTPKYRFISGDLSRREIISTLRQHLNSLRIAIGVNNHMGSKATEDSDLMKIVLSELKKRNLVFVDSRTSLESIAYDQARRQGLICGYNEGFLDAVDDIGEIQKRVNELIAKAKEKGKIIVIAHPRKNTIKFLKEKLPALKKEVEFITIKEYFDL